MARKITDYLEQAVCENADKIAFADINRKLTYHELYNEVLHIAYNLIDKGYSKEPIVVCLDKSVECISCFLGIAYSSNFYSIIDVNLPMERILQILEILKSKVIITDKAHAELFSNIKDIDILLYEDTQYGEIDLECIYNRVSGIIGTDILYVLFTSGSTGKPKGVVTSHHAVIEYAEAATEAYSICSNDILGNQYPFYFVGSIEDIYLTLRNAATMYIIPQEYFMNPLKLVKYMEEKCISTIIWVPSAMSLLAKFNALEKADFSCLKKIVFGGEVLPINIYKQWKKAVPDAIYINGYGSTEVTAGGTYYIIDRDFNEEEVLPLGKPFNNNELIVVNENGEKIIGSEIGELYIRSASLSLGYYDNKKLTDEFFVSNPFNTMIDEKIFKTGDLVKYNESGELIYVGRADNQVKRNGYRIELEDIEKAVIGIENIEEACCVWKQSEKKIYLFFSGTLNETELDKLLRKKLPGYMIPDRIRYLFKLPHNQNGKIDRRLLLKRLGEAF